MFKKKKKEKKREALFCALFRFNCMRAARGSNFSLMLLDVDACSTRRKGNPASGMFFSFLKKKGEKTKRVCCNREVNLCSFAHYS